MSQDDKVTYHIYGRKSYPQSLEFVDSVVVAAGEDVPVPDGEDWVEVIAFPETAVIQVIPWTKENAA